MKDIVNSSYEERQLRNTEKRDLPLILVVECDRGIRDGIEDLLTVDGYTVLTASDEQGAAAMVRRGRPDLILVCVGEPPPDLISAANRIRESAQSNENIPVVIFCGKAVAEGAEVACGSDVYVTSPENFNQLRSFLKRLLIELPNAPYAPIDATRPGFTRTFMTLAEKLS